VTGAAIDQDVAALAVRIAQERIRHSDPDDIDGRRRSRLAFRRWRERIPEALSMKADVPILISRHRQNWLGSAGSMVRSLDPAGLGAGGFHAVDAAIFGDIPADCLGFTFEGLFDVARASLPVSARRGPAVAINVPTIVAGTVARFGDTLDERSLVATARAEITAVGLHEAAHAIDQRADDKPIDVPPALSFPIVRSQLAKPRDVRRWRSGHGGRWVRAMAHFCHRATRTPPGDWWLDVFTGAVGAVLPGDAADWLDALALELATAGDDEPIVDVLARDPPPAFSRLFDQRSAATAA